MVHGSWFKQKKKEKSNDLFISFPYILTDEHNANAAAAQNFKNYKSNELNYSIGCTMCFVIIMNING